MSCRKFFPISLSAAVLNKLPQIYESTTYHAKMDVRNGILRPCVTSFGMKNTLEIPNGRNITPQVLFRSTAKSMPEKPSAIAAFQKAGAAYCMVNTRPRAL